MSLIWT